MFEQQGHAAEGPRAGATLVLLDLGVRLQVGAQVGAVGEGPVTVLTGEGPLTWWGGGEQQRVRTVHLTGQNEEGGGVIVFQMIRRQKSGNDLYLRECRAVAIRSPSKDIKEGSPDVTGQRAGSVRTCVRADVTPEQPRAGEGLSAGGADAGQRVRADVHLQGAQAGVLLGAVFAVEGRAGGGGGLGGERRGMLLPGALGRLVVGRLVVGQRREAAVAAGAAQAVERVLHHVRAGGVGGAPAVLLLLLFLAAGRSAAEVQGAERRGGRRRGRDGGQGRRQDAHATEGGAGRVAGQGEAAVLRRELGLRKAFWDKRWRAEEEGTDEALKVILECPVTV